jgi:hypothetical protein
LPGNPQEILAHDRDNPRFLEAFEELLPEKIRVGFERQHVFSPGARGARFQNALK